ncbi:MAG TPA: Ig-like domain-containing protein [Patescibacteria group bacterium]|nr:Ig-like domain-containing protein [Patescibacteria group bacterium]
MKKLIGAISFIINVSLAWNFAYAANVHPLAVFVIPSAGSSLPGKTVTFVSTYTDLNGWKDIKAAYFLVNTTTGGSKCLYVYYDRLANKLYLRDDTDTQWLGGYAPRSNNTIENTYARLDCADSEVYGLGITLVIKWSVVFKPAFSGEKKTYLYVVDQKNASHGWVQRGKWAIKGAANHSPLITSVAPADNSIFLANAKVSLRVDATDEDNDPLEYQFSVGGKVMQAWSNVNTYLWQTSIADVGSASITGEVRDGKGGTAARTVGCSIINPTAEEVLQKVADNYAKISDFTADMIFSSTLNGNPIGETEYCRYYFKAPDKEKTETYSDATRSVKTDIVIMDGVMMHLINPVDKATQSIDLTAEAGINSAQFNQTNLYYKLADFLSQHAVSKNNSKTDFENMVIAIDAVPQVQNSLYSLLQVYVDLNKGLATKVMQYKNDVLLQVLQVDEAQEVSVGAWLPKRMTKKPSLESGDLVSILEYANLHENVGLGQIDFNP